MTTQCEGLWVRGAAGQAFLVVDVINGTDGYVEIVETDGTAEDLLLPEAEAEAYLQARRVKNPWLMTAAEAEASGLLLCA